MTTPQGSGLTLWRRRQAEDKREKVAELERLRAQAMIEVRDGREFVVVRVPDRYVWRGRGAA